MESNEDDGLDGDFFMDRPETERIREQILDEGFEKAKAGKFTIEKNNEKKLRKKPFFLLGIVLIIIGASCFVTVNYGPWLYIKYEPIGNENVTIEKTYYKDFQAYGFEDEEINNFFEGNGSKYLGIAPDDFSPYLNMSNYAAYVLLIIGIIFTIIQILSRVWNFGYRKSLIIHSIFAAITAIIFTYLMFVSIKFFAAFILYLLNYNPISLSLGEPFIAFIAPVLLLFVFLAGLKACFVVLKSDYNEVESIFDSKRLKKSLFDFRFSGGNK